MTHSMNSFFGLFAAAIATVSGAGCGGSNTSSKAVSSISISPSPCVVVRTQSAQLSAEATFPDGTTREITSSPGAVWTSENTQTLTVDATGIAVGVNSGSTNVTITYEGASSTTNCTVSP